MPIKLSILPLDGSHPVIILKDKEKLLLGRNRQTGIRDTRISRNHVELTPGLNVEPGVTVRFVGQHCGELNGVAIVRDAIHEMKDGDTLCLLKDQYKYKLKVEPLITEKSTKRKHEEDENGTSSKRLKRDSDHTTDEALGRTCQSEDDNDSEHVRSVEEKLLKLKQSFGATNSSNTGDVMNKVNDEVKPNEISTWHEEKRLLIYNCKGLLPSEKIASFDLDGTLITTQSGKVFPTSSSDWKFLLPEVPGRLKELNKNGYKIVIFSNQMGLAKGKVDIGEFKAKVEGIVQKIGVPIQAFISSGPGLFRKPCSGMWDRLVKDENDNIEIDMRRSYYVGDAGGRPKDWQPGKKKDFSCSDRLFSINIGLNFETPEEFFRHERRAKFDMPSFDPRSLDLNLPLLKDPNSRLISDKPEVIIMVGYPAAGKSHFVRTHLSSAGLHHISRDTLGSWQKCVQRAQEALKSGKSVAIDNTNPDKESRKRYISISKEADVPCRCFVLSTSLEHSRHNERFREMTDKQHQPINDMIFNSYKSKYQEPELSEGFDEIVHIKFEPGFSNEHDKKLYQQFLLEK